MIVWGTYVSNKVAATGQFYCPACKRQCAYNLRRPKKWGHVYWIPLVPLQELGPYVECTSCKGTYGEHILRQDATSAQQDFDAQRDAEGRLSQMICQVMSLMAGEKTNVSPQLCDLIANAQRRILKIEVTPANIYAAIAAGPDDPEAVLRNVEQQAASLTDRGKELVLRAALVAAPRPITDSRRALAADVARRLGMAPERAHDALREFGS